ncbi:MAG: hypothetical protein ACREC8_10035 [Limisphaerales bacterium]
MKGNMNVKNPDSMIKPLKTNWTGLSDFAANHALSSVIRLPFRQLWMSRETLLRNYPAVLRSPDLSLAENDLWQHLPQTATG